MNLSRDQTIKSADQPRASLKLKELWAARSPADFLKPGYLFLQHLQVAALFLMRSRITTILNVFCITVLLLMLGLLLAFQNSNFLGAGLTQQKIRLSVFIKDSATEQDWASVESKAQQLPGFQYLKKVDKKTALAELRQRFSGEGDLFVGLDQDNPLPASSEIFFDLSSSRSLPDFALQFRSMNAVDSVAYDGELLQIFSQLAKALNRPGAFSSLALILLTIFLISSTVRLSMFHQQEQIDIMSLVGASPSFVQAPFIIGAAIQGLLACLFAMGGLFAVESFWTALVSGNDTLQALSFTLPFTSFRILLTLVLVALGAAVAGSYLSARSLR